MSRGRDGSARRAALSAAERHQAYSCCGDGIYNDPDSTIKVEKSSNITGSASAKDEVVYIQDVYNLGVLHLDSTRTIGDPDGNLPS